MDLIDLGLVDSEWQGQHRLVNKLRLVFETEQRGEDGRNCIITKTFTASLHPKAKLSDFVGKWRGRPVVPGESIDLSKLIGANCTLVISHQQNMVGRTYASIDAVSKPTKRLVVTNTVALVSERTNIVFVTNAVSGAVSGYAVREPVATNMVTAIVTNIVPVFMTNLVQVPVTNLVAKPEALATIEATGSIVNTFAPGIGSILALALGGLYHGYRQVRNRKVNEALVQGVETARAVLTTTPQGQSCARWYSTVLGLRPRSAAISFVHLPAHIASRTCPRRPSRSICLATAG